MSAPAEPEIVVDLRQLDGFTEGDRLLEQELAGIFLQSALACIARLDAAARAVPEDREGWKRAAHALKGGAANLGARRVARRAADAEHGRVDADIAATLRAEVETVRQFFAARAPERPQESLDS